MIVIITLKIVFLVLFTFAVVQKFVPSIHNWLNEHQSLLSVISIATIVTFTISYIDILINT